MNLGQRLVDLTAASPFTGAGMSLVTALVALAILVHNIELDHATLQSVLTTRPAIADQMSALLAARQVDLARKGGEISAQAAARATEHRRALGEKIRRLFNLS